MAGANLGGDKSEKMDFIHHGSRILWIEIIVTFKLPRPLLDRLFAFAPNRATLGGTAYFIQATDQGQPANILIDAPAYDPDGLAWIQKQGGVRDWVITHRGAIGQAKLLQAALGCKVWIQEQEAYLLPDVSQVHPFQYKAEIAEVEVMWTPGHSPGSACVYWSKHGGVLFTGRHLLPDQTGNLRPLRFSKTFHWPRQLQQVKALQSRFTADTLAYICPAANTGFLRRTGMIADAYTHLQAIAVEPLYQAPALL